MNNKIIGRPRKDYSYLIGQRFGKGVVIQELERIESTDLKGYKRTTPTFNCKCDCGNEYSVKISNLQSGATSSCGCSRRDDLTNKTFGYGTVISFDSHSTRGKISKRAVCRWKLKCECGNEYTAEAESLKDGSIKSCGCYKYKFYNTIPNPNAKYNLTKYIYRLEKEAKPRNLNFKLTKDIILNKIKSQNYYCKLSGLPISFDDGTASVDRIDSDKDYTEDNIQIVYRTINFMKSNLTQDKFINFCSLVADHNRHL